RRCFGPMKLHPESSRTRRMLEKFFRKGGTLGNYLSVHSSQRNKEHGTRGTRNKTSESQGFMTAGTHQPVRSVRRSSQGRLYFSGSAWRGCCVGGCRRYRD